MKRIILCGFLVIVMIVLGAGSLYYTDTSAREAEETLEEVSLRLKENDMAGAKSLTLDLRADWESYLETHFFATDHEHVMELTSVIVRICALAEEEDPELSIECAVAKDLMRIYRKKTSVTLGNIF